MSRVLCLLQNFHSYRPGVMRHPTYGTAMINRKNATYCRFVPHLEAAGFVPRFAECTPIICVGSKKKFPTDLEWVLQAVEQHVEDPIISFGTQAHKALVDLKVYHIALPHPAAFAWRRQLIVDVVADLKKAREILQKR